MNHVWLVVYSHRGGADTYAFRYESDAKVLAQELAVGGDEDIEVRKVEIR